MTENSIARAMSVFSNSAGRRTRPSRRRRSSDRGLFGDVAVAEDLRRLLVDDPRADHVDERRAVLGVAVLAAILGRLDLRADAVERRLEVGDGAKRGDARVEVRDDALAPGQFVRVLRREVAAARLDSVDEGAHALDLPRPLLKQQMQLVLHLAPVDLRVGVDMGESSSSMRRRALAISTAP
jgi:hypothetical protein